VDGCCGAHSPTTVSAGVFGRETPRVTAEAGQAVAALELPTGVTVVPAGAAAQTADAFSSLGIELALSVLFVYMILCAQFASFVHPFTIMLALPFSIVGALVGLFVTGKGLHMLAFIGLILLMGLVTKNSILLVDLANQLRQQGRSTREALLEAGPVRLRPILMTTLAMVFGMLPLALGIGTGAELRQSMGIGVIGGLLTSTVPTLVAVPVAYSLVDDLTRRVRKARRTAAVDAPRARPQAAATPVGTRWQPESRRPKSDSARTW
jgi:HAE1 family hydrophobic/amphiphilic exporter-1